jgi:hypothetical protein
VWQEKTGSASRAGSPSAAGWGLCFFTTESTEDTEKGISVESTILSCRQRRSCPRSGSCYFDFFSPQAKGDCSLRTIYATTPRSEHFGVRRLVSAFLGIALAMLP